MPEQDGFALLREIRNLPDERQRNIAVIALTAYVRPEDQARVHEAGFQAHLEKPVDPSALIGAIRRLAVAPRGHPGRFASRDDAPASNGNKIELGI
jgi:CheY-like chemotaxis protein